MLDELTKSGLFPEHRDERLELQKLNPLELRATALENQIPLHHIGRALFHLNQRRGFKSNRKDKSEEVSTGKVSQSSRNLLQQMELIGGELSEDAYKNLSKEDKKAARMKETQDRLAAFEKLNKLSNLSYGSYLWERQKRGLPTRARPNSDTKLYEVYPTRELLEDEFHKIWNAQAVFYPDQLTDEVRDRLFSVIFTQRKLKSQPMGKCTYFPNEDRAHRAMPSFQRFRILQEVNLLTWSTSFGVEKLVEFPDDRNFIVQQLERPSIKTSPTDRNATVSFKTIRNALKKRGTMLEYCEFNLESESRKNLIGNQTTNVMQHEDCVGSKWHDWPLNKQDKFVSIILDDKSDEDVRAKLSSEFGLDEISAENCLRARLVDGTAQISLRAARALTDVMDKEFLIHSEAVERVSESDSCFKNPYTSRKVGELEPNLPYYGQAIQGHIVPGTKKEQDEQSRVGMVSNPTVHIALNQLRLVINELILRYGHPDSIAIELARNLPVGKKGRDKIKKEQLQNQKDNEKFNEKLEELGQETNRANRLKLNCGNNKRRFASLQVNTSDVPNCSMAKLKLNT